MKINKRYKDLFEEYIHRGESTTFTIGTICTCVFCFVLLVVSTFSQITFSHPVLSFEGGISFKSIEIAYNPQFPVVIFIAYLLGRAFGFLACLTYIIVGLFFYPIFAFGGGLDYIQNYFFGYLIGFFFAIIIAGKYFKQSFQEKFPLKYRFLGILYGILSIHIFGFIYCIFLAIFGAIDFGLVLPIFKIITLNKIIYDIFFSSILILIAPYVKNIFWVFMRPCVIKKKKAKNIRKRYETATNNNQVL